MALLSGPCGSANSVRLHFTIMTKKNYVLIAKIVNSGVMAYAKKKQVAEKFVESLQKENPHFNKQKFLKACGCEIIKE